MRWPRSFRASAVARSTFASLAAAPFLPPTVGDLSDKRVDDSKESSTRFRINYLTEPSSDRSDNHSRLSLRESGATFAERKTTIGQLIIKQS